MAAPGINYPKDYALINLILLSSTSSMDMKNMMVELSYHEDLFNNTTSGYLLITDSMGYIESLNLNGNEYLRMTFGKTSDDKHPVDKLYRVFAINRRKLEENMSTESYTLEFCSEELIISEQYKISKSYKGGKISENIQNILEEKLQVPENNIIVIEPSYGVYDFVIPTMKPFAAINWLASYARPKDDKPGADMFLYEDKFGYNFRSLQSLMSNPTYRKYSYNPKNIDPNDLNTDAYNVTTYEILNSFDSLDAINSGVFANQLLSFNTLTREKKVTNFDYSLYQNQAVSLNPAPITNNATNKFGHKLNDTPESVLKLVYSNFNQQNVGYIKSQPAGATSNDIFAETYIPYRTAQIPLMNYTKVKISVPGDSNLTVGMVVDFSLLSINPTVKKPDAFYSGRYLISALRHIITVSEFKTILEIVKDSTPTQYASPDTNSVLWQNTTKGVVN